MRLYFAWTLVLFVVAAAGSSNLFAQAYAPTVHFTVTLPDGTNKDLDAHESGMATVTVNGHDYGIRPTMMDDQGTRIVMTIFDLGSTTTPVHELGEVEVKAGGTVATSKSQPAFKIKVGSVTKGDVQPKPNTR